MYYLCLILKRKKFQVVLNSALTLLGEVDLNGVFFSWIESESWKIWSPIGAFNFYELFSPFDIPFKNGTFHGLV